MSEATKGATEAVQVLVIEDGFEYVEMLTRFIGDGFLWERAGSGPQGLARLRQGGIRVVFLDMRFDRAPADELLGDWEATVDRFNGDPVQARRFLEDHQGTFILAMLREEGIDVPVLLSYDFDGEPRRFERLKERFGPLDYLPDAASPAQIREKLASLMVAG